MKLMVPGPGNIHPEDLRILSEPASAHYGVDFLDIWNDTRRKLKFIMGSHELPILIPGSGTAGTEMALCGLKGDKCLIIKNGYFSDRLEEILKVHGAKTTGIDVDDRKQINLDVIYNTIEANKDAVAVVLVHSETSTGMLNPIKEIGELIKESGLLFIVDTVSSFGAINIEMENCGIDACWTASQKALSSPAGLSIVYFSQRMKNFLREKEISSWYLNPNVWLEYENTCHWHPYPVSMPVHIIKAVRNTLNRTIKIGIENQYNKHKRYVKIIRDAMQKLGLEPFVHDIKYCSPTISSFFINSYMDVEEMIMEISNTSNILIANGIGKYRNKLFRVGHLGELKDDDIYDLIEAIT